MMDRNTKTGFELGIEPKELNILENFVVTKRGINSSKGSKILDISKLDMFELNPDYCDDMSLTKHDFYGDYWIITFNDGSDITIKNLAKFCRDNEYNYNIIQNYNFPHKNVIKKS